jgi:hypothetical protein
MKYSQAEIFGLIVAWRSKLTVCSAWGKRRSQRYGGNAASTLARMERKWFFEVPYHSLGFVSPVHVKRHKLELSLP